MPTDRDPDFSVMIPCSQDDFATFVSGLLGKPQTLERFHTDAFEVHRRHIENTFHLVDQRVRQQNVASLVQFTVRVVYHDNSSVLLNSLDDFIRYTEVRPLVSVGAHLTWVYLITFPDRRVPEKQQIEVTFSAETHGPIVPTALDRALIGPAPFAGFIATRISHTARTWGVDIDSLLQGHMATLARPKTKLRSLANAHSGKIGLLAGTMFLAITATAGGVSASHFLTQQLSRLQSFLDAVGTGPAISQKLDFLLQLAVEGTWTRFAFLLSVSGIFVFFMSIFLGILIGSMADNVPASFVVLTDKAQERQRRTLLKEQRRWLAFVASIFLAFIIGLADHTVFALCLAKWLG